MTTSIAPRDLVARARERGGPHAARQLEQTIGRSPVPIHEGPLEVSGPWWPSTQTLVIDGPLTVDGALVTDRDDYPPGLLILLGPVRCTHLLGAWESTTLCVGSLHVDELLFAATRDLIFYQFGPLRAGALVSSTGAGTLTSFHDDLVADAVFAGVTDGRTGRDHAAVARLPRPDLRRAMVDEVLSFEEWDGMSDDDRAAELADGNSRFTYADFDETELHRRFRAGEPVLRSDWRAAIAATAPG